MNNGPWTLSIQSIVQMHKPVLQTTSKQQKFLAIPQQVSSIFTFKPFSKRSRGKWRSRAALWCKPMMPIIRLSAPASPSVSTWASEINKFGTVKTSLFTYHLFRSCIWRVCNPLPWNLHDNRKHEDIWKGRLTVRLCEKVHNGAEMGVMVEAMVSTFRADHAKEMSTQGHPFCVE